MTVGRGGIGASVGRVPMLAYLCGTPVLARRYLDISNEQQKARDQTLPVDTANFANEFDDGAPPPSPLPSSRSSSRACLRKKKRRFVLFHQIFVLVAISNESSNEATPRSRAESKDCERGVVNDRRFSFLFFFSNRDLLFAVKFYDTRG